VKILAPEVEDIKDYRKKRTWYSVK